MLEPAAKETPASSADGQTEVVSPKANRKWAAWLVRLLLGLLLVGVLLHWQGEGVRTALSKASPIWLLTAVVIYLSTQIISAAKWQMLLNAAIRAKHDTPQSPPDEPESTLLSLGECYRLYLVGMFWNLWMPTAIGGDAMRAYLGARRCGDLPLAASSIFIERLTGFVSLIFIGMSGAIIYNLSPSESTLGASNDGTQRTIHLALAAAVLCVVALVVIIAARTFAYRLESRWENSGLPTGLIGRVAGLWIKTHRALDTYLAPKTRRALVLAIGMSLCFQSAQIALNFLLANAVGLQLPLIVFVWAIPALGIASMLPLGIGGLGVREAAAVGLLSGVALKTSNSPGQIIAWSLMWQVTLWLSALPGALAHLLQQTDPNIDDK